MRCSFCNKKIEKGEYVLEVYKRTWFPRLEFMHLDCVMRGDNALKLYYGEQNEKTKK